MAFGTSRQTFHGREGNELTQLPIGGNLLPLIISQRRCSRFVQKRFCSVISRWFSDVPENKERNHDLWNQSKIE